MLTTAMLCRYLKTPTMALCLAATAHSAMAGNVEIPAQISGSMSIAVTSMKEAKFRSTLHQQYDFSCGSAALATLLTHHYGIDVDEKSIFEAMFDRGDKQKIRREGFSLLDMKEYLASRGFEADGFEASIDALKSVGHTGIPGIVLVNESGYNHFVVVKGLGENRVLIGDPANGTRALTRATFDSIWKNKILFVISNHVELATFNASVDWSGSPRAPVGQRSGIGAIDIANWAKLGASDF